jgi:iron complex outermembrane recepter protein
VANQIVNDPETGTSGVRMTQTLSGNPDLDPEKADTWVVGVVLQPTFAPGLQASIDYYDIKIEDAIATSSSQFIIDRCYEGLTEFCSAITRDPVTNQITAVNLKPFNALEERATGVDFEVSYTTPLAAGDLDLRWLATYVDTLEIVTPVTTITRAGEAGNNVGAAEGTPNWRWVATATYGLDDWTFQLNGRYIGSAKVDDAWSSVLVGGVEHPGININDVSSVFYLDAYVGYKLDNLAQSMKGGEVYVAVENFFDEDPPGVPLQDNSNTVASGTNPFIYDVVGTTLRAGVRFEF